MPTQGLFAKKRKSILQEVADFPAGVTNDGVFGHLVSGKKYIRARSGVVTAEEAGIFADETDMTSRFNAVLSNPKVKVLDLHLETGGTIYINGSVNGQGKTIRFTEGTTLAGTGGTITNFKIIAPDTMVINLTLNGLNFLPTQYESDYISAHWWGFKPNTGANMTPNLQRAVNIAIGSDRNKTVLIAEAGSYVVKDLLIANFDNSNNAYPATCSIRSSFPHSGYGVQFSCTDGQSAVMHIQTANNVNIENIQFSGVGPYVDAYAVATDATWAPAGVSGSKVRPHAAATIDHIYGGVGSTIAADDKYPGVPAARYNNVSYGGSTNVRFINCSFNNFFCGIAEGLSGCPNGEGIAVQGGYGAFVAYFWMAGQLQSRENIIRDFYFLFGHTFLTNICGHDARGDVPSVNNSNICYLKMLFNTMANFTFPRFQSGYSEGMVSMGRHTGSTPVNFVNWTFTTTPNNLNPTKIGISPVLAECPGSLIFSGGAFIGQGYAQGFPFNVGRLVFNNGAYIEGGTPFITNNENFNNIHFEGANWATRGSGAVPLQEGQTYSQDEDDYVLRQKPFLSGNKFIARTNRTYSTYGLKLNKHSIGAATIAINTTAQTLTFTAPNIGLIQVGDVIGTDTFVNNPNDDYAATRTSLGWVSGISGSTVTVTHIPLGLTDGQSYNLFVVDIPLYQVRTMGQITSGQNVITNVRVANSMNFTFQPGNRIKGKGILPGTYVVAKDEANRTLTISTNATSTEFIELYDQQVKVTTTDNEFIYLGGPYRWYSIELVYFKGDEVLAIEDTTSRGLYCIQGGHIGSPNPPVFYRDGDASTIKANVFSAQQKIEMPTGGVAQIVKTTDSFARIVMNNAPTSGMANVGFTLQDNGVNRWSFLSYQDRAMIFNENGIPGQSGPALSVGQDSMVRLDKLTNARKRAVYVEEDGTLKSFPMPYIRTITADGSLNADDYTLVVNSSSSVIVSLPTAASVPNRLFNIKRKGAGSVVLDPNGSELIDGAATANIRQQWDNMQIQSDGTEWFII